MSVTTSSPRTTASEEAVPVEERTRRTMDQYLEALLDRGDFARFFADDVVWTTMETGDRVQGRAAVADLITGLHTQMFDAYPEFKKLVVSARSAFLEAEFVGNHTGDFFGIAPTGIELRLPYAVAYEVVEDSIVSLNAYFPIAALVNALKVPKR